jgi:hypothetical protein
MIAPDDLKIVYPTRRNAMKKLMTMLLGLSLVFGVAAIAQDTAKKDEKKTTEKKTKKAKKTTEKTAEKTEKK